MTQRDTMHDMPDLDGVVEYFQQLQSAICHRLEILDPEYKFKADEWRHENGGGGCSRVIENGNLFEKGGVNFSRVEGKSLPKAATLKRPELADKPFVATGVSLVLHPRNPYIPTTHMNVRFFIAGEGDQAVWWFGGGYDLTPYYGFDEDCQHWHQTAKVVCERYQQGAYARFKSWCDDYFYLPHRKEPRGIGGIFFDDLNERGFADSFAFVQSVGDSFTDAYVPILERRQSSVYGERERQFQCFRRGRYVEFNLVYDRGTLFGLQSGGRTESILMSLPPVVNWRYDYRPSGGSAESELYQRFLAARDWV